MKYDKPYILKIQKIITESERVKTFVFDFEFPGEPGQFVMTWIPGYDELPFGIINKDNEGFMISVGAVGEATKALHDMKEGDLLGFRGPYGNSFTLPQKGETVAMVAGGYGMVPLSYLAQQARKNNVEVHMFIGARTSEELLFKTWMNEIGVNLHLSTDDGSEGYKGFNTDLFAMSLQETERRSNLDKITTEYSSLGDDGLVFDRVYTVGPEIMEAKIAKTCWDNNIPFEVSLERYMKCGMGICGSCTVDPTGWRMCVEGPILNGEQLKKVEEFNKYHRDATGKPVAYPWAE